MLRVSNQDQVGGDPIMFMNKSIISMAIALCLVSGAPAFAAEPHAHGNRAAEVHLRLDNGKKWQTDDVLRRGMSEIRAAIAESLTPIHDNVFTPEQYGALAARIQAQIDYVVGSCKLPEKADQQLHLVLEQIIDGVAGMKAATGPSQGAAKIVGLLLNMESISTTSAGGRWYIDLLSATDGRAWSLAFVISEASRWSSAGMGWIIV